MRENTAVFRNSTLATDRAPLAVVVVDDILLRSWQIWCHFRPVKSHTLENKIIFAEYSVQMML